jgi:hypothetical protein
MSFISNRKLKYLYGGALSGGGGGGFNITDLVIVESGDDIAPDIAGVRTMEDGKHYWISAPAFSDSAAWLIPVDGYVRISFASPSGEVTYTGTGGFIRGTDFARLEVYNGTFLGVGTNNAFDLTGKDANPLQTQVFLGDALFSNFSTAVDATDCKVVMDGTRIYKCFAHVKTQDCNLICKTVETFNDTPIAGSLHLNYIVYDTTLKVSASLTSSCNFNASTGETGLYISPIQGDECRFVDGSVAIAGGDAFLLGDTGSIQAFSNPGGGQTNIQSSGHGLSVNEQIIITGGNDYNGSYFVDAVIDVNNFRILKAFVTADNASSEWRAGSLTGNTKGLLVSNVDEIANTRAFGECKVNGDIFVGTGGAGQPGSMSQGGAYSINEGSELFAVKTSGVLVYTGFRPRVSHILLDGTFKDETGSGAGIEPTLFVNGIENTAGRGSRSESGTSLGANSAHLDVVLNPGDFIYGGVIDVSKNGNIRVGSNTKILVF